MTPSKVDALLTLPQRYEDRRVEVAEGVVAALDIVRVFAKQYGWSHLMREPFFYGVEVHATQDLLWQRILELHELPDQPVPTDALTAALEQDILLAVVPEEAERARPEYFRDRRDWVRALAHEIVHRLHVRVLGGDEDAMGPEWFFEGFAVLGSGQTLGNDLQVRNVEQALNLARSSGRGAYARYAATVRFFAEQIALPELVAQARRPDFDAWLRAALRAS